jgi:hypothetical protein
MSLITTPKTSNLFIKYCDQSSSPHTAHSECSLFLKTLFKTIFPVSEEEDMILQGNSVSQGIKCNGS